MSDIYSLEKTKEINKIIILNFIGNHCGYGVTADYKYLLFD